MAKSLLSRRLDLVYFIYFCVHVPVMFLVDLTPLYPAAFTPSVSVALRQYYIVTFQDQFMVSPPPFFIFFMWMEALFHVPLSLWSIYALFYDNPKVPLILLVYGLQTLITTATCMAEYFSWTVVTFSTKLSLTALYGPYLALALVMSIDMFCRLYPSLGGPSTTNIDRPSAKRLTRSGGMKEL